MYDVVNHANKVSDARFGRLSADTAASKMTATTPVLFTPTIGIIAAAAVITAIGSI